MRSTSSRTPLLIILRPSAPFPNVSPSRYSVVPIHISHSVVWYSSVEHTAVTAETAGDFLTAIGDFGDLLGRSFCDFKVLGWYQEVIAVVSTTDSATVRAMAQSLCVSQQIDAFVCTRVLTVISGSPVYSMVILPQKQLPVGIVIVIIGVPRDF